MQEGKKQTLRILPSDAPPYELQRGDICISDWDEALRLLRAVEWKGNVNNDCDGCAWFDPCPVCASSGGHYGHEDNCALDAFLDKHGRE